jgi:Arc/MetJ family transcription regulator
VVTVARLSVTLDETLLAEAQRVSGARNKRETIERALAELIRRKHLEELASLAGSGLVAMTVEELQRWREASGEGR